MKTIIIKLCHWILWKLSDDAMGSCEFLDEMYDGVPENLKKVVVWKDEYHTFKSNRKEVIEWLNREK